MKKVKFCWLNGKIIKSENAKINILCHGLHYGSGVFEGIRCYNTKYGPAVFRLKDHIKRLIKSAKFLDIKIPFSPEEIKNAVFKVIKKNNLKECYIRPIIFYGEGKMGLDPAGAKINFGIFVWPWGKYLKESVKIGISKFIRLHPRSIVSEAKICGYYVNSILATKEVKKRGYDEAILLDYEGFVAEGPGENIFIVKNKISYTPKKKSILPGITRNSVIKILKNLGYKVIEKDISKKELYNCDEAFFTGTAAEITPILQIEKYKKNIGPISLEIKEKYKKIVKGEEDKYIKWLDFVK